jgi:hypothetical protein
MATRIANTTNAAGTGVESLDIGRASRVIEAVPHTTARLQVPSALGRLTHAMRRRDLMGSAARPSDRHSRVELGRYRHQDDEHARQDRGVDGQSVDGVAARQHDAP